MSFNTATMPLPPKSKTITPIYSGKCLCKLNMKCGGVKFERSESYDFELVTITESEQDRVVFLIDKCEMEPSTFVGHFSIFQKGVH